MPEHRAWPTEDVQDVRARLRRLNGRLTRRRVLSAGVRSAVAAVVLAAIMRIADVPAAMAIAVVTAVAGVPPALAWWRARAASPVDVARQIESAHGVFDNLLLTAAEIDEGRTPALRLGPAVARAAREKLAGFDDQEVDDGRRAVPVWGVLLVAAVVLAAGSGGTGPASLADIPAPPGDPMVGIEAWRVEVAPPAYTNRPGSTFEAPDRIEVPVGSRLTFHVISRAPHVEVQAAGDPPHALSGSEDGRTITVAADRATVWALRARGEDGESSAERLLPVAVIEDRPPGVRIVSPGSDQLLSDVQRVPVRIEAADDYGLTRLALRYTHVTGSGETFTFSEGELPVRVTRRSAREWHGEVELDLAALGLERGDSLVYRAAARDVRPGATDVLSDSFLIEIGGLGGAASGGFALPEDEHRHAISQQMVIIKTEALHGARARLSDDDFLHEAQHLSAEQRMVRAEFVFMTGGHVHDEVEEAEHSHELAEGRFENEAMVEMLAAVAHMSRAERLLVDGNTGEALVAERLALGALQRAFDRRRYFLRTTPERSRIELDRRLSGTLDEARSWVRPPAGPEARPEALDELASLMRRITDAMRDGDLPIADVARGVAALEPGAPDVQDVVARLAGAPDAAARADALAAAAALVRARAARWLAPAAGPETGADPASGRLRQVLERGGGP